MSIQNRFLGAAGFCLILGLTGEIACGGGPGSPSPPPRPIQSPAPITWKSVKAVRRTWQDKITVTGTLMADPNRQSLVGAPTAGRITRVLANLGDTVQPGQVLATFRSEEIAKSLAEAHHARIRLELAQKTLSQRRQLFRSGDAAQRPLEEARTESSGAKAELQIAAAALEVARKKYERTLDLRSHGISTQQQLEDDQANLRECQARYQKAQGQLEVAQERTHRARGIASRGLLFTPKILEAETETVLAGEEVEHTRASLQNYGLDEGESQEVPLRAPSSGTIILRNLSQGQWVSAQQELFQILDSRRLWLWLYLYEQDALRVRLRMTVLLPEAGLQGRVSYLAPELDASTRTQKIRVEVANPGKLRVGMFVRAVVLVGKPHEGVCVPNSCVQTVGASSFVFIQNAASPAVRTPVKIGLRDRAREETEILTGVEPGQQLISDGAYFLQHAGETHD